MSEKHTPGPWTVSKQFGSVGAIKAPSGFVAFPACSVREIDETRSNGESWLDMRERTESARKALAAEVQANASLIAAAPEMLEALQAIIDDNNFCGDSYGDRRSAWIETARAAIAKAIGEQQ